MPSSRCCSEFSRAELLRGASVRAGAGLPAIEAGMPLPAGTGLSRRTLLARSAGLGLAVYGARLLSPRAFEEGIAAAGAADGQGRVLVSVFLPGGIDSLSLVAPTGHAAYAKLRPNLRIAPKEGDRLVGDPSLQWHPRATGLRDLHAAGKLTVLPAIGYDHPDQSHFTSRHFWEVGQLDASLRVGWMGRYLDRYGSRDNPLQGLSLEDTLAPALAPSEVPVAAVGAPEGYDLLTHHVWDDDVSARMVDVFDRLGGLPTRDGQLASVRSAVRMATALRGELGPVRGSDPLAKARGRYPKTDDPFPRRLASVAQMVDLGMPLKCVCVQANGEYDTHAGQAATLPGNIALLSESLAAFQADLDARGIADRVIVHVWSEFGRRAQENGNGTDHGAAGVSLIMGSRAAGGVVGEFGGLASSQLDGDGNLRHTTDFRAVYKTLVEGWLGGDSAAVLPEAARFATLPLLKS